MDEQDGQNLNIPQGSSAAVKRMIPFGETIDTPKIGYSDSQLSNLLSCNCFHPLCNQAAYYGVLLHPQGEPRYWQLTIRPTVLSPRQILDAGTLGPDMSDGILGEFEAFADVQVPADGSRPGRRITDQGGSLRGTNPPFDHWNGNEVQPPNPFRTTPHGQSVHVSPQQLQYMTSTHPTSHFEQHLRVEAPENGEFQPFPEIEIAQGSKNSVTESDSKRWPCPHEDCNRSYGRRQEVKRHIRDNHYETPKCFLCDFKWTRAEKIRKHLISKHRGRFTEEERQKIRRCRGLDDTIDFLNELELAWL